jgi:branched-chain amino acid transport system substrate-binding protein
MTPCGGAFRLTRLALVLGAGALAACGTEVREPAIGYSYNFGDTAFESLLNDELERTRPEGGLRIRVVGADAAFRAPGMSALSAEVWRATALASDPSVIVSVGPGGSREALQVAPIYREAKLADLVPTATSRLLADAGAYTMRLAVDDSAQGAFIGAFADSVLRARVGIIVHVPDEYGMGLAAGTSAAFAARGIRLLDRVVMPLTLDCRTPEQRAAHTAIASEVALRGVPDVVVLAMRTVEAGCLAAAMHARFPRAQLIAGDGTYLETQFLERAGPAAEGVHLVAFWHPHVDRPGSREFAARLEARLARRVRHGDAMFYDAVMLGAAAIRAVGPDRERVHRWLRDVGTGTPPFEGITGPISLADGARRTVLMTRVEGTRSVVVAR